ncbi:MAG: PEGA domain-containing protein [Verrucomicrobia bacterium]|nr:PEGA domain-containing protein [Verrucomicrobiota bacterium]
MRLNVSLLAFCVALAGCKSSIESDNIDSVVITSTPTAAAVRINGQAMGRTPTTIQLDRTQNYELQVGKGGFLTETSELKPRLITTSEGVEFGFPAAVKVNLTKVPAAGEAGVPPADDPEFKKLSKKALGEEAAAKENLKSDIAATKEAAVRIQAALAAREATAKARLAEIAKSIADAKAAKGNDESAKKKLAEAELALAQANADAEAARAHAEKNLKTVEARQAALAGSDTKVAQAKEAVVKAKAEAQPVQDRLSKLEQTSAAELQALKEAQANAAIAIKALTARAELNRLATNSVKEATAGSEKSLAQAKQELAAERAAAAKAKQDAEAKLAEANQAAEKAIAESRNTAESKLAEASKAAEKALAEALRDAEAKLAEANKAKQAAEKDAEKARLDAEAKLAEANKAAEKAVADARLDAEAKLAEANKVAAAARAQAEALKYSEFSSRYALLENKRRAKEISEEDYKAALAALRKELGL